MAINNHITMQIEFSIPEATADQLRARCDEENVTIEEFCAAAVLDKLFGGLYGDLNEKVTPQQQSETDKPQTVVNKAPIEENVQEPQEEVKRDVSNQQGMTTTSPKKKRVRELKSK